MFPALLFCFFCVVCILLVRSFFFFFNDTATTEIYTLSLHDALPIYSFCIFSFDRTCDCRPARSSACCALKNRSEEHTSELQSHSDLVCRLLLEKKKMTTSLCQRTGRAKQ